METQKTKSQNLFFIQRLLIFSLIISGVLTYFIACSDSSSNDQDDVFSAKEAANTDPSAGLVPAITGLIVESTDFSASALVHVTNKEIFKRFLGNTTGCGTEKAINSFKNLLNGPTYTNCSSSGRQEQSGVENKTFDGTRCLREVEKIWSASYCDNFTSTMGFGIFYNKEEIDQATVYLYIFDDRGTEVGVIAYTGVLATHEEGWTILSNKWSFDADSGEFYSYIFDKHGQPWINKEKPSRFEGSFSLSGFGKVLEPNAYIKIIGINGKDDDSTYFEGHLKVRKNYKKEINKATSSGHPGLGSGPPEKSEEKQDKINQETQDDYYP